MEITFFSKEQTLEFGKKIGQSLKGGEMILLNGDMGAGKTTLTKGIALGLDISDEISSPTFTLLNIYSGRLLLYHYDLFRLESIFEAEEAGLTEFFGREEGVSVVEWADKLPLEYDEIETIKINLDYVDENTRKATVIMPEEVEED